jgi:hypothetical protein
MFSVVIPTMWRSSVTEQLLRELVACEAVGEIFIINNAAESTPEYLKELSKVTEYSSGKNEYVNPSWNLGVQNAKFDLIALCNDDILFNTDIFKEINILDDMLVGLDTDSYSVGQWNQPVTVQLKEVSVRGYGFGCLLLFNKQSYRVIPEQFKIWCGDDYLFEKFKHVYALENFPVLTEMSVTTRSDPHFLIVTAQDAEHWHNLKKIHD